MNKTSREFLTKLAELMADYKVEIGITEYPSTSFTIPYVTEEGYPLEDYVTMGGHYCDASDIFDLLEEDITNG